MSFVCKIFNKIFNSCACGWDLLEKNIKIFMSMFIDQKGSIVPVCTKHKRYKNKLNDGVNLTGAFYVYDL